MEKNSIRKTKSHLKEKDPSLIKKIFGTLKLKKSTQQVIEEIDEGYD